MERQETTIDRSRDLIKDLGFRWKIPKTVLKNAIESIAEDRIYYPFYQYYFEGRTDAEIALDMGIDKSEAHANKISGKKIVRSYLNRYFQKASAIKAAAKNQIRLQNFQNDIGRYRIDISDIDDDQLQKILKNLPEKEYSFVTLYYDSKYTMGEIAELYGYSKPYVYAVYKNGMKHIAGQIANINYEKRKNRNENN